MTKHQEGVDSMYLEEVLAGAAVERAVLDLGLFGQVVGVLDRRQHAFDGEERGQVGRVRRDDDEGKEPPGAADDPPRQRPATSATSTSPSSMFLSLEDLNP